MGFVISILIGWGVLLWIAALFMNKEPWQFALKGVGATIALGFLAFFLFFVKALVF